MHILNLTRNEAIYGLNRTGHLLQNKSSDTLSVSKVESDSRNKLYLKVTLL